MTIPMLVVMSGMPGAGKSSVADAIARAMRVPVFSVDPMASAMVHAGLPNDFRTGLAAYLVAEVLAEAVLRTNLGAVVDAVNALDEAKEVWPRLADRTGARLRIIECVVHDVELQRARIEGRSRGLAIPEPTWADVERRREEWTPWVQPHLTLDTACPLVDVTSRALEYLESGA